jgi:hypothetical protein
MAVSRNVSVACLFVLCPLVSAFAQTTTFESRVPDPLSSGAAAIARDVSPQPSVPEPGQTPKPFLDDRLAFWRQRLQLNDWRVSIAMARSANLPPKTLGGIRWDKRKKSAVIYVLDAADYRLPFREMLDDMELTILHELVHLELASLPHSRASRDSEEQAVSGIADAMLALDRKKP